MSAMMHCINPVYIFTKDGDMWPKNGLRREWPDYKEIRRQQEAKKQAWLKSLAGRKY